MGLIVISKERHYLCLGFAMLGLSFVHPFYLSVVITNLFCDVVVAFMFLNQQLDLAQLANQVFPGAWWCLMPHNCTGLS